MEEERIIDLVGEGGMNELGKEIYDLEWLMNFGSTYLPYVSGSTCEMDGKFPMSTCGQGGISFPRDSLCEPPSCNRTRSVPTHHFS